MKHLLYIFLWFPLLVFSQSEVEQAELLFRQGKYDQARSLFLIQHHKNPNNLKVIEYLGDIEGHYKKWEKAKEYYTTLKKAQPTNANYQYKYGGSLGMMMKEMNKFKALYLMDELKTAFQNAIKYNPKHIEARWALLEINIQLPPMVGGSELKAQEYANQLFGLSPVDGYLAKGHIAEYYSRYKDAEFFFKKAIEVSGGSKNSYIRLLNLYKIKMKLPEKAAQVQEELNKKHP